jgi:SAM-dependent methyltransferase
LTDPLGRLLIRYVIYRTGAMWRDYFNQKAVLHQGSVRSSDYFSEKSFLDQRRNILEWIGPIRGARILDAGCGVGAMTEGLAKGNLVVGVDLAEAALRYARGRRLAAVCADSTRLPFAGQAFDLVLSVGVLQIVDDDQAMLESLHAHVKPGEIGHRDLNRSLQKGVRPLRSRRAGAGGSMPTTWRRVSKPWAAGFERAALLFPLTATTRGPRSSFWAVLEHLLQIRGRRPV